MALFAMLLSSMMAFAGFGVDVSNWWYNGQRLQRAADAAALAGVVFMPGNFSSAKSTAEATAIANGLALSEVSVTAASRPNQVRVTVTRTVNNSFTSFFGVKNTVIRRSALAEYTGRVAMGSPENKLGNDPDSGFKVDNWLSVSGRAEHKQGGDRYQNGVCTGQAAYNCPNTGTQPENPEFDPNGYTFVVRVNENPGLDPLVIQAFDPALVPMNTQDCGETSGNDSRLPTTWDLTTISDDWGLDAELRYDDPISNSKAAKKYCLGDVTGSGGTDTSRLMRGSANFDPNASNMATTTFIVRAPDGTPATDIDNPVISTGTCSPRQFAPWAVESSRNYYQLLDDDDGYRDSEAAEFSAEFRRWVTLCTIPPASVQSYIDLGQRDFIVQIRLNSSYGNYASTTAHKYGRNHLSLRAGYGSGLTGDVDVYANGRMALHAGFAQANTTFYIAKVGPEQAGRTLTVEFFDVGDASVSGTLTIQKPVGSTGSAFTCAFRRVRGSDGVADTPAGSGCSLTNVNSSNGYQGSLTTAFVSIPSNYSCDPNTATGCWVTILFAYPSGGSVSDHTTWNAGVLGDPVRLVE